ncbi:hypothetical protein WA1_03680 [Scytonema hofmannii PCC 7110]|uniref:Uncharacterized protein n=1 Tax=Scytonema hofmannii PCC 7110 TaxID=128403 RepID=A0A139X932_9CYAN|nr:hypothetical protein WA1_03680 [Scytonema hofmannii PCC 7110]
MTFSTYCEKSGLKNKLYFIIKETSNYKYLIIFLKNSSTVDREKVYQKPYVAGFILTYVYFQKQNIVL